MGIDRAKLKSITVLHEDEALLVVSKPCGLSVHGGEESGRTVLDLLSDAYEARPEALELLHRLDRGTSGVLLLSKARAFAKQMRAAWPDFSKRYWALCHGAGLRPRRIEASLGHKERGEQPSATRIEAVLGVELEVPCCVAKILLETGRTHQIRKHLADIGHPVVMDTQHGDFGANRGFRQAVRGQGGSVNKKVLFLHAHTFSFTDPRDGNERTFSAPLPPHWTRLGLG